MKETIAGASLFLLLLLVIYAGGTFIELDVNFRHWGKEVRVGVGILEGLVFGFALFVLIGDWIKRN